MQAKLKSLRKSTNNIKILGVLLCLLILPIIINSPLFSNFFRNINSNEKFKKNLNNSNGNPLDTDYFRFYKVITIDHTKVVGTGGLNNFPVLISIFDSDLRNYAQSDGDDIAFFNGSIWLDHEIELFNQIYNNTHAQLIAWVRLPFLSASIDTIIYMYFGNSTMEAQENPSGVWNNNYLAVQHLQEISGVHYDSTANGNDGSIGGPVDQSAAGKIDGADEFSGTDDKITIPQSSTLKLQDAFTIEMWIKINSFPDTWHTLFSQGFCLSSSGNYPFSGPSINIANDNSFIFEIYNDTDRDVARINDFTWSFGEWYHLVCSYDKTYSSKNQYIYIDGMEHSYVSEGTNQIGNPSHKYLDFCLGLQGVDNIYDFDGIIDEVRISNINISANWIKTEYNNQYDPDSFYSIGSSNTVYIPSFTDFKYYKVITIDHTKVEGTGSHTNFPVLISIYDSELHDYAQPDGDDIVFSDGVNWLDHETEVFIQSYSSTHAHFVAWVRLPSLSTSTDTIIYMYYGNSTIGSQENPAGVWNSTNYEFVHHLHDLEDSTITNYDGTAIGSISTSSGIINGAYEFNGIGDYIQIDYNPSPTCRGMSFWLKFNSIPQYTGEINVFAESGTYHKFARLYMGTKNEYLLYGMGNGYREITSYFPETDIWYYMVMSSTGSSAQSYLNGQPIGSIFYYSIASNTAGFAIGANSHENNLHSDFINGTMDEVRLLKVQRSASWIATEYNNQVDPNSFYSVSGAKVVYIPKFEDYNFFKMITIDHTKVVGTGSHNNFPVLISLFDSDLHSDVKPNGEDIAFANETDWYDFEIELFNQNYNSTHAQLVAWVRVPHLSTSSDTTIYMYYGNSTLGSIENRYDVWNSKYAGVWHLSESIGSLGCLDSTSYETYGTLSGGVTQGITGQIDGSYEFDDSDDQVLIGNPLDNHLDFGTESFTVSYWIKLDQSTGDHQRPIYKGGDMISRPGYEFETNPAGSLLNMHVSDGSVHLTSSSMAISYGTWLYVTGVIDRSQKDLKIYKNGIEVGSGTDITSLGSINSDYDLKFSWNSYAIDGNLDEVRIAKDTLSSDWITTEYYNQYNPSSFYSVGMELSGYNIQINAIDLYGNFIPNVNVSIYRNSQLITSKIANSNGSVLFTSLSQKSYNYTVSMKSSIGNHFEIINKTLKSIIFEETFKIVDLICNASTNFLEIKDIDGLPLDSGWIIVGNNSHDIQNCSIDSTGHARFWWLNTTPYQYNYSIFYKDINFNPKIIKLASGDINTPNSLIIESVNLTTVNFTTLTFLTSEPISGVKLIFKRNDIFGDNIVNLTTNIDGKATLRWLNSSGINGNYSLQVMFFEQFKTFNMTDITEEMVMDVNFRVKAKAAYDIWLQISLENFRTEIKSLNPTTNILLNWGSELKLRALFNITKAGGLPIMGPSYADAILYKIKEGDTLIQSGTMLKEIGNVGRYHITIDTFELQCDLNYLIIISGYKSGFTVPSDVSLTLSVIRNDLILNQSENDDSAQTVYWLENVNMSVKPYGQIYERFNIESDIFHSFDHRFRFSIPSINSNWNLSRIVLNIYNITFGVLEEDISFNITDDYGVKYYFNSFNCEYYYSSQWDTNGSLTNLEITLNQASKLGANLFNFLIEGTFLGDIDIVYEAFFIRDNINVQYSKFNITNSISIISAYQGWAIKNVTFEIYNCYYTSNWTKVDLSYLTNLNITTNEGFKYFLDSGDSDGNGILMISDLIIYPLNNQFLFTIESSKPIMFDVNLTVEYIQEFYKNQYLETYNMSRQECNVVNGGLFQVNMVEEYMMDDIAILWIKDIYNGSDYFVPSELGMNITIGGQKYSVLNTLPGQGLFYLNWFNTDILYTAIIETNQPVNFTIFLTLSYLRITTYETTGAVTFIIKERPYIGGVVQYNSDLAHYVQTIDTSLIDADDFTIKFTISKDHYISATKELELQVLNRLTLINGEPEFYRSLETIYVKDAVNFTFLYTDAFSGAKLTDLKTQNYIWEKYSINGSVIEQGKGNIITTNEDLYKLDFDTEMKTIGEYLLIITLDKDNYDYKNIMIFLTIVKRELGYSLSENFKNSKISIEQGKTVPIEIKLTDPTKEGIALTNATILLIINDIIYEFEEYVNGTYILNFPTNHINTFFSSETITGTINITKEDYISEEFSINIVVKMEEIFPGVPTFYFLIILFAILISIGGIVSYRIYKYATIPTFVKKTRAMQKAIKGDNSISESLIYPNKEIFIGEIMKDKWDKLGLSLGDILGIEIKKTKKLPEIKRKTYKKDRDYTIKPKGFLLMKWDERIGTELLVKHPKTLNISDKTLMQVYSTHEYSAERGLITLTVGSMNILSYYTGPESGYYVILLLDLEDDPDEYEGAMVNVAYTILQNIEDDSYLEMIPLLFQRLTVFPHLNDEQNLGFYYLDELRRMIIKFLQQYGVISKSELLIWLKEQYTEDFFDIEAILNEFIKRDIIKVISVKGMPSELIFLTKDVFMLRVPPINVLENLSSYGLPAQFRKIYRTEVQDYFRKYIPSEEDNLRVIDILIDPDVYEVLHLLRTTIGTMNSFEKLKRKGVGDIYSVLKKLWDAQMIRVFKDENKTEYFVLTSDFYIDLIFPKYLLNAIKLSYEQKSKSNKVLMEFLRVLEDTYYEL